jgi:hypothetical protein
MQKNMKARLILLVGFILMSFISFGQAKKPTLMILPSDNWCEQRYFMSVFDNQGTKQKIPNYKQAFQEDTELGQVISKIGSLMIDRGFPLKDAEQELKAIETRNAEDNMTASNANGAALAETPLDKLKNRAKSDIIVQIWWKLTRSDNGRIVSFTLEALDAYTSKRIASSTGNSAPNNNDIVPEMLLQAVSAHIDPFMNQLQGHFNDLLTNGREIKISVRRWNNWDKNLESEVNGDEIRNHIYDWLEKNTQKSRFSESNSTENRIDYEQVRIPLFDERNRALDARQFTIGLQKYLKAAPYNIDAKLMTRGLGEAILVLGEK